MRCALGGDEEWRYASGKGARSNSDDFGSALAPCCGLAVSCALAVFALALYGASNRGASWLFIAGISIFSGSLYLMAVTNIRWLGAITPVGGLCFLAGWAWLLVSPPIK